MLAYDVLFGYDLLDKNIKMRYQHQDNIKNNLKEISNQLFLL
jgi:hypothetical protein